MSTEKPRGLFTDTPAHVVADRLGLPALARRTYDTMMARPTVSRGLHAHGRDHQLDKARAASCAHESALAVAARQMVRFARAGATYAELQTPGHYLLTVAGLLIPPGARDLGLLDSEETRLDGEEDQLQTRRLIFGASPSGKQDEAAVCRQYAAIMLERARTLEAQVAQEAAS